MTKITKPLVRETDVTDRGEIIVVEMHAKYALLRLKGKKQEKVTVGWGEVLDLARRIRYRRDHPGRL